MTGREATFRGQSLTACRKQNEIQHRNRPPTAPRCNTQALITSCAARPAHSTSAPSSDWQNFLIDHAVSEAFQFMQLCRSEPQVKENMNDIQAVFVCEWPQLQLATRRRSESAYIRQVLKTELSAHRQTDRQTDKSENSISASFTPFTWRI